MDLLQQNCPFLEGDPELLFRVPGLFKLTQEFLFGCF
jgi:hypothetical protein